MLSIGRVGSAWVGWDVLEPRCTAGGLRGIDGGCSAGRLGFGEIGGLGDGLNLTLYLIINYSTLIMHATHLHITYC